MKYKALILDLDGTTIFPTRESMPSDKVVEAVKKAKKHVKIAIATGRPSYLSKNVIEKLEITEPCVFNGGSEIIDVKTGEFLYKKYLSVETQKEIAKICLPFGYKILNSRVSLDSINNIEDIKYETGKLIVIGAKNEDIVKILEELSAIPNIAVYPTISWDEGKVSDIHITDINASKRHGIEFLLKILKIKKEETIGIGDGYNDFPLFHSVGLKVAMGNAPKELKDLADYIAPSIDQDGVADVISKYIL